MGELASSSIFNNIHTIPTATGGGVTRVSVFIGGVEWVLWLGQSEWRRGRRPFVNYVVILQ